MKLKSLLSAAAICVVALASCSNSAKTGNGTIAAEDTTEIIDAEEESVGGKNMRFLKETIEQANREFPQKADECTTVKEIFIEGDYVVYLEEVDEDVVHMDLIEMSRNNIKDNLKKTFDSNPTFRLFINACTKAEKGIAYKYVGDQTGKAVYIRFPISELKDL